MSKLQISQILRSVYRVMEPGKPYKIADLLPLVQIDCGLTDDQMKEVDGGKGYPRVKKYVEFAVSHLHVAGLIYKKSKGVNVLIPAREELLTLNDADFNEIVAEICNSKKTCTSTAIQVSKNPHPDFEGTVGEDVGGDFPTSSLALLTCKKFSNEDIKKKVLTALFDAEYNKNKYGVEYDVEELIKDFVAEKCKSYTLEIIPEEKKKTIDGSIKAFIDCHIYLTDENAKRTEIKMKAQEKAIYLMFLLYNGTIKIKDFPKDSDDPKKQKQPYRNYLDVYEKIQRNLVDSNFVLEQNLFRADVTPILTKIRNKIADVTNNRYYIEQFAVEGYKEEAFNVAAATQEQRDLVIEVFNIPLQKLAL